MLRRGFMAAAVLALLAVPGSPAAPTVQQPANGRIAFSYFGRLIVTNPDGTGQWPLTPESLTYHPGSWSPDGSQLAIVGEAEIYLVDARGRGRTQLTFSPGIDTDPSFSPDGSRILFVSDRDGGHHIWLMNADGSSQRRVTTHETATARDPAWSPDGGRIAWTTFRDGNSEIYTMKSDGTDLHRVTRHPGIDARPAWSPDGSRIAFESNRDGNWDIYTVAVDGSDVHQLTTSPALDTFPEWSPDGSRIAFMSERTGGRALFVMDPAGRSQTQLTLGADPHLGPAWQPLPREPLADETWGSECTIWGTRADDLLVGTPRPDVVCGLEGNDRLLGGEGHDTIVGGAGHDSIVGGPGHDIVATGPGDDLLDLRDGQWDSAEGGADRDTALVDRELDRIVSVDEAFDPDPRSLTRGRPIRASLSLPDRPAEYAVDGHTRLIWGAYFAPQWLEVDLGRPATLAVIELVVAQTPAGSTRHVVLGKAPSGGWRQLVSFRGETRDGEVLRHTAPRPWQGIRWLRVVTRQSPSWVAWREIRALAPVRR
jgi:WD40-like Beta Propeller Repeat/RTX calcium-binding nonapeptide repeat (4 copies)